MSLARKVRHDRSTHVGSLRRSSPFRSGSVVEWWYTDPERLVNIKIYPVFPTIRPTVLRFTTTLTSQSKKHNETDILDASILLRHVNVDDTGVYRCVIRPWTADPISENQDVLVNSDANLAALTYQVQLTGKTLE